VIFVHDNNCIPKNQYCLSLQEKLQAACTVHFLHSLKKANHFTLAGGVFERMCCSDDRTAFFSDSALILIPAGLHLLGCALESQLEMFVH